MATAAAGRITRIAAGESRRRTAGTIPVRGVSRLPSAGSASLRSRPVAARPFDARRSRSAPAADRPRFDGRSFPRRVTDCPIPSFRGGRPPGTARAPTADSRSTGASGPPFLRYPPATPAPSIARSARWPRGCPLPKEDLPRRFRRVGANPPALRPAALRPAPGASRKQFATGGPMLVEVAHQFLQLGRRVFAILGVLFPPCREERQGPGVVRRRRRPHRLVPRFVPRPASPGTGMPVFGVAAILGPDFGADAPRSGGLRDLSGTRGLTHPAGGGS